MIATLQMSKRKLRNDLAKASEQQAANQNSHPGLSSNKTSQAHFKGWKQALPPSPSVHLHG